MAGAAGRASVAAPTHPDRLELVASVIVAMVAGIVAVPFTWPGQSCGRRVSLKVEAIFGWGPSADKGNFVTARVDFSANAPVYDRRHGAMLSDEAADCLMRAGALSHGTRVLDIGAGTGRVAIPLAVRGCDVVALEPARGMIDELRAKARNARMHIVAAEGSQLPFAAPCFDAVIVARLLYLTTDWAEILREAYRVLVKGGCLMHEWGNGTDDEEWVQIREKARSLFIEAGVPSPFHPGVRSETLVGSILEELGFSRAVDITLGTGPSIALKEFLRRLVEGELSYIWDVPETVRADCLPSLMRWAEQSFDLERPIAMPRTVRWTVHHKPS